MKTHAEICAEIKKLEQLAADNGRDEHAQISITGQIDALRWVIDYEEEAQTEWSKKL